MKFQKMIDYVFENYPELDMDQDFLFYFDVDEYLFGDNSKTRSVMHIFIDIDWKDHWKDNPSSMIFVDAASDTYASRASFKMKKPGGESIRETEIIDLDETTLKNLLELAMQDKRKLEKKAKKEIIDATSKRYDA